MSENLNSNGGSDLDRARHIDPERGAFEPPQHPLLADPHTNPRGVRHIDETAQDQMAAKDRPRYQAAQGRRVAMITATKRRLQRLSRRPAASPRSGPPAPKA